MQPVLRQGGVHRPPIARIEHTCGNVVLPLGIVYIGRGVGCFLRLDDPAVSRVHLAIEVSDQVVARDLSSNGTLINGKPLVGDTPLADGDVLTLSEGRSLRVHIEPSNNFSVEDETASLQIDHRCPRCRSNLALEAANCKRCGLTWRRARPGNPTEPVNGAIEPGGADRRAETRHPVALSARYRGARQLEGMVQDISAGGLFFVSNECDEPGTACSIELSPSGTQPATFTGSVVRVLGKELGTSGMGIKFDPLKGQLTRWLAQYLLKQLRDTSADA